MIKNAKAKGSRNERRSRDFLEQLGYRCTKAGGSLGVWDIIGIGKEDTVLVQVKSNRWPSRKEVLEMSRFPCPDNHHKCIHRWDDRQSGPRVRRVVSTISSEAHGDE